MESKESESGSTQKHLPANYDPGWNDPPKWISPSSTATGTVATANAIGSKRTLNKRVPFPLSSEGNTHSKTITAPTVDSRQSEQAREGTEHLLGKEKEDLPNDSLKEALENLRASFEENVNAKDKIGDFEEKMEILKKQWTDGFFTTSIERNILEISRALREKEDERADRIHLTLMMNHSNVCSPWISLVRQIVLELKEKKEKGEK